MEETQQTSSAERGASGFMNDPSIERTVREDPLLRFIVKHKNILIVLVIAIVAGIYARNAFREVYEASMGEAGDEYSAMRSLYSEYQRNLQELSRATAAVAGKEGSDEEKKKIDTLRRQVDEQKTQLNTRIISLSDENAPYKYIAELYRDLLTLADSADAAKAVSSVGTARWRDISSGESSERFIAELRALAGARALLDGGGTFIKGQELLSELAERAAYVHVSAALTLARVAQNPEEKAKVIALLKRLSAAHPEQSELIFPELSRLEGS